MTTDNELEYGDIQRDEAICFGGYILPSKRYYECRNCGQVVQGWNAAHGPYGVQCCEHPDYVEVA